MQEAGLLDALVAERYASWKTKGGVGEQIMKGKVRHMTEDR